MKYALLALLTCSGALAQAPKKHLLVFVEVLQGNLSDIQRLIATAQQKAPKSGLELEFTRDRNSNGCGYFSTTLHLRAGWSRSWSL